MISNSKKIPQNTFSITTIGLSQINVSIINEELNIEFNADDIFGKDKEKNIVRKETKIILFHPKAQQLVLVKKIRMWYIAHN